MLNRSKLISDIERSSFHPSIDIGRIKITVAIDETDLKILLYTQDCHQVLLLQNQKPISTNLAKFDNF